jgi:UDP-N-acetyl-2-amino-2-deoxyglucuronate dehydrogenase
MQIFTNIVDRKIRIAIVGCGRIAKNHFGSVEKYPDDLELVSVCDNNHNTLEQAVGEYKVKGYLSVTEMLAKEKLDVISLCTPSGLHPQQAIEAAEAGVHVISEKPMATRWKVPLKWLKPVIRLESVCLWSNRTAETLRYSY